MKKKLSYLSLSQILILTPFYSFAVGHDLNVSANNPEILHENEFRSSGHMQIEWLIKEQKLKSSNHRTSIIPESKFNIDLPFTVFSNLEHPLFPDLYAHAGNRYNYEIHLDSPAINLAHQNNDEFIKWLGMNSELKVSFKPQNQNTHFKAVNETNSMMQQNPKKNYILNYFDPITITRNDKIMLVIEGLKIEELQQIDKNSVDFEANGSIDKITWPNIRRTYHDGKFNLSLTHIKTEALEAINQAKQLMMDQTGERVLDAEKDIMAQLPFLFEPGAKINFSFAATNAQGKLVKQNMHFDVDRILNNTTKWSNIGALAFKIANNDLNAETALVLNLLNHMTGSFYASIPEADLIDLMPEFGSERLQHRMNSKNQSFTFSKSPSVAKEIINTEITNGLVSKKDGNYELNLNIDDGYVLNPQTKSSFKLIPE